MNFTIDFQNENEATINHKGSYVGFANFYQDQGNWGVALHPVFSGHDRGRVAEHLCAIWGPIQGPVEGPVPQGPVVSHA